MLQNQNGFLRFCQFSTVPLYNFFHNLSSPLIKLLRVITLGKAKKVRERVTDALDLPKEITQNLSHLSVVGEKELFIENYKGILEYTPEIVRVKTHGRALTVTGRDLEIRTITDDDLQIVVVINTIEFVS